MDDFDFGKKDGSPGYHRKLCNRCIINSLEAKLRTYLVH